MAPKTITTPPSVAIPMLSKEQIVNREHWLSRCAEIIRPHIEEVAHRALPKYHISVGFPSRGALSTKRRVIGQCWDGMVSADGKPQLFLSPVIGETEEVAATVAHELIHTLERNHLKPFGIIARGIFLAGKLTATESTPEFWALIEKDIKRLGLYPHSQLVTTGKLPQPTRLLKISCSCGVVLRGTLKAWNVNKKKPLCGCGKPLTIELP